MIVSSDPGWLQGAFSTLLGMFYWVGLRKNIGKTVGMVCCMCQTAGTQSEAAYERQMTGAGLSYQERQQVRVQGLDCGEEMTLGSLAVHIHINHGKAMGGRWNWGTTAPGGYPRTYKMVLPTVGIPRNCPVKGCRGKAVTWTSIQVHFLQQHVRDNVVILEEGNLPHHRCPRCDMLVP